MLIKCVYGVIIKIIKRNAESSLRKDNYVHFSHFLIRVNGFFTLKGVIEVPFTKN